MNPSFGFGGKLWDWISSVESGNSWWSTLGPFGPGSTLRRCRRLTLQECGRTPILDNVKGSTFRLEVGRENKFPKLAVHPNLKPARTGYNRQVDTSLSDGMNTVGSDKPSYGSRKASPSIIEPTNRLHVVAGRFRAGEVVTANLADFHGGPAWMIDEEDVPDRSPAKVAGPNQIFEVVVARKLPSEVRLNNAVFPSVTALTERLAEVERVLPQFQAGNIALVVNLKDHPIFGASAARGAPSAI
ncbi:MAG: hypothetical protein K1X67_22160 [Fimbriimonadaceae bacterium]|nr:hypothetical protein [Fimbriimonadaceae bacterium]